MEKLNRYIIFFIGLYINSLGVALITKASLGTSPISSIPYVLSLNFPFTLGNFTIFFSLFLIFLQLLILRKNFKLEHFLQIPISVLFGYFIDWSMILLGFVNPHLYLMKLIYLLIGCLILGFGVYTEVLANVAMLPGESFVRAIVMTWHTEFGVTKICFDVSMAVIAGVLSFVFAGKLDGVREGTIIAALLVGFIARLLGRFLSFWNLCFSQNHRLPKIPKFLQIQQILLLSLQSHVNMEAVDMIVPSRTPSNLPANTKERTPAITAALLVGFIARLLGRFLSFVEPMLFTESQTAENSEVSADSANTHTVIAIAREYGSGGHDLGEALAKRLGFDFYDNEIIQMAAGSTGYDPEFIKNNDEQMRSSLLYDLVNQAYSHAPQNPAPKDNIFAAESKVILDLASKGNCVVIGRCADYILRNRPHCMRIFLHAPAEYRVKRIMRTENLSHDAALTKAIQMNRKRSDNYHYYTHQPWGLSRNYHLTLDTSLGDDFVLDSICKGLKHIQ